MLSIVVPVYNEVGNIPRFIAAIKYSLYDVEHEIIIVDDNSPDGTGSLAEDLAWKYNNIKVLHRDGKRGVASAIADGVREASGEVICTINADMQHPVEMLPVMFSQIAEHDIVIGSRFVSGGSSNQRLLRMIVSKGAITLVHLLLRPTRQLKDPISGMFLFKRKVITDNRILPSSSSGNISIGVKYLLELLMKGQYNTVKEVPITFEKRNSGKSKFSLKDCYAYLKYILNLMRTSGEFARILKFGIVGGSGIGINVGVLYLFTESGGLPYIVSAIFSWEAAILSMFSMHEIWTFHDLRTAGLSNVLKRALRFNMLRLVSLLLNLSILALLTELLDIYYLLSALVAITIVVIWNYLTSLNLVWRKE